LDQALEFFEDEIDLFKELYEAYPNNVSFKNGLAISYSKLGATHTALYRQWLTTINLYGNFSFFQF